MTASPAQLVSDDAKMAKMFAAIGIHVVPPPIPVNIQLEPEH